MEQIRNAVDAETFERLDGINCCIPGCFQFIPGDADNYKQHVQSVHKVLSKGRNSMPIACGSCSLTFYFYKHFIRHVIAFHKVRGVEEVASPDFEGKAGADEVDSPKTADAEAIIYDEKLNPLFFAPSISLEKLKDKMSEAVTLLRADVSLPESKVGQFMLSSNKLLQLYQRFVLGNFKRFMDAKGMCTNDIDCSQFINSFEVGDPFQDVKSPQENISYLALKSNGSVSIPQQIVLGQRRIVTKTRLPSGRTERKCLVQKRIKTVKDVCQYISVIKTLEMVMRNPEARTSVYSERARDDDLMKTYKDGTIFKYSEYFSKYPFALRLIFHLDEVEYLNPLGSRKGNKKLTNVSFKVQNFDPKVNSSLSRLYLALTVETKVLKKYGYQKVLQPLIEELKILESDDGYVVRMDPSNTQILHAILVNVVGDTAALHEVFAIMGPQSTLFCRICYISRSDLHAGRFGDVYPHRTAESIEADLQALRNNETTPTHCGLVGECCFHELRFFNYGNNRYMDPMHDMCEGVNMMVMKLILQNLIVNRKLITCSKLNEIIDTFQYGTVESENKPSANFSLASLKSSKKCISQFKSQCWLLLRAFPFMFGHLLQHNKNFERIIGALLIINRLSFSNKISVSQIDELESAIRNFHELFTICFPGINAINKIHHLAHYPEILRSNGPITSCFIFEGKFKESKGQAKTCHNFKNITYSIAKRMNFRQINSILNHEYALNLNIAESYREVPKACLDFSLLLFDFPEQLIIVDHLNINGTKFKSSTVAKYEACNEMQYGVIELIVAQDNSFVFIINKLQTIEYNDNISSLKVQQSNDFMRIYSDKICTRKAYNLWKHYSFDDGFYYISLKFSDD